MPDMTTRYEHSGHLGMSAFLVPVAGVLAAVTFAVAYAYADVYIPFVGYLSFLLTIAFAAGVGFVVSYAAFKSKCRNLTFLHIAGFLIGVLALYSSWVSFEYVLISRDTSDFEVDFFKLMLHPAAVWEFAENINENGWYTVGGTSPSGTILWVLWLIEALIIVGGVTLISAYSIRVRVYCERCDHWCGKEEGVLYLGVPSDGTVLGQLRKGSIDTLSVIPSLPASATPHLRVDRRLGLRAVRHALRAGCCPTAVSGQDCAE